MGITAAFGTRVSSLRARFLLGLVVSFGLACLSVLRVIVSPSKIELVWLGWSQVLQ